MSNTSETNWSGIDAMTDEDIDTSDSPPLSEEFFAKTRLRMPVPSLTVLLRTDSVHIE